MSRFRNKDLNPVDVIAVVTSIGEKEQITPKTGKQFTIQYATLLDTSRHTIEVGFYGNHIDSLHLKCFERAEHQ